MIKKAHEIANITTAALDKKAREFIVNNAGPVIIKAAEEGKDSVYVDLLKKFNMAESERVGPIIAKILGNEFDYNAKFETISTYQEESAYVTVKWGHAI